MVVAVKDSRRPPSTHDPGTSAEAVHPAGTTGVGAPSPAGTHSASDRSLAFEPPAALTTTSDTEIVEPPRRTAAPPSDRAIARTGSTTVTGVGVAVFVATEPAPERVFHRHVAVSFIATPVTLPGVSTNTAW
jgi:hypothetical protein